MSKNIEGLHKRPPNPDAITLFGFESLSLGERMRYGIDLAEATKFNDLLYRELPYVHKGYSYSFPAIKRIKRIARTSQLHGLWAGVISDNGCGLGVGTLQRNILKPQNFPNDRTNTIELSYWHRSSNKDLDIRIGEKVVDRLLIQSQKTFPFVEGIWSVTLPEDEVKRAVLTNIGMVAVQEPQEYSINDSVTEHRQLWALERQVPSPNETRAYIWNGSER